MVDSVYSGYRIDLENREWLKSESVEAEVLLKGELPEFVDPRLSPDYKNGWLQTENQLSIGSCEGNSLTECFEYCIPLVNPGHVAQFSRMYAYIASQMESNLRGDVGATLEGGTKAAKKGLPFEKDAPYTNTYPGWGYVTEALRELAKKNTLNSITQIRSADAYMAYVGSGIGIAQIGMPWNNYMQQTEGGYITDFRPGARDGGHAVALAGYITDDQAKKKSSGRGWALLKNSHDVRYAFKGWAYLDMRALDKILNHSWTSCYGRSDLVTPKFRPLPVDWTKESMI